MKPHIVPVGDAALLVKFGDQIDPAVNRRVLALDTRLRAHRRPGIIEMVPAYASLLVHYDPAALTFAQSADWVNEEIPLVEAAEKAGNRRIDIPVRYGGEEGPDLPFVAGTHNLAIEEAVRRHAGRDYHVYMMGFTPGFAYLGMLDETLATPRLERPRLHVPAGSVAIADRQTGVYPIDSPGGWRLIGRTTLPLFDVQAVPPFLLAPGDTVRFVVESVRA
jgi:inhibitor of KinA